MKTRFSNRRNHALTLIEVLVVIVVLAVLAAILLPMLAEAEKKSSRVGCVNRLATIGLAYPVWAGDNGGKYPMAVSVINGGAMELVATGNVAAVFQVMSNELDVPKLLICPADTNHMAATDFGTTFNNSSISYFLNLDASTKFPQAVLSGDDNFEISGVPVKSGLLKLSTNTPISWTAARHHFVGNILVVDGSVQMSNNSILTNWTHQIDLATNRLAIP